MLSKSIRPRADCTPPVPRPAMSIRWLSIKPPHPRSLGSVPLTSATAGSEGGGGVVADQISGHIFVTNSLDGTVSVLSGASNSVVATVLVGADPFGVAVDPITRHVFVGNRGGNSISAFAESDTP